MSPIGYVKTCSCSEFEGNGSA